MSTAKAAHTPGPWKMEHHWNGTATVFAGMTPIFSVSKYHVANAPAEETAANAARIVACVNACEGIENPEAVGEVMDALAGVCEYWDEGTSVHPNSLIVADLRAALAKAGVK